MLARGTRLGHFEILAPLGAGGMGEVYRARDLRLGRDVAIKVLPAERMADEGRRKRFAQEARAASALNHPHIITIHDIDAADGIDFIVMEYLPGQSLAKLVAKGAMPAREALPIAIAIADALAAAHGKGIVHRDVKPANVLVASTGVVKVLDFGLAKLTGDGAEDSSATTGTLSEPLTAPGAITGTAAYMSPEQATGGTVDARSDIFSFGVVLYQLIAGQLPFPGPTAAEARAAVVRDEPRPPRALEPAVPEALERLVLRCLRKAPARRFQHMGDVKLELEEIAEALATSRPGPMPAPPGYNPVRRGWIVMSGALVAVLGAAALLWLALGRRSPPPTLVPLSTERWAGVGTFSPDGTQIAYASAANEGLNWDIWVKLVGDPQARRVTSDPAAETQPAWSPDGTEIAFLRLRPGTPRGVMASQAGAGEVYVVSPLGGRPRRVSDLPVCGRPSWSPDGRWLAVAKARSKSGPPGGIFLVSTETGESHAVTRPESGAFDVSPALAPDGRALAYAACTGPENSPSCSVQVLALDPQLQPVGKPRTIAQPDRSSQGLCWTRDGRSIVYTAAVTLWRVRVDGGGAPERLELAGAAIAPTTAGTRDRLAFVRLTGDVDLYRIDEGGRPLPIARSTLLERAPRYSPDGRRIVFETGGGRGSDIWLADGDGSNPTRLIRGPELMNGSPSWSTDGRFIAFDARGEDTQRDIWIVGADGSGLRRVTRSAANDITPSWSHDGRFVYFSSDRTRRPEVYRTPVDGGSEEQLTERGGLFPVESVDGRELYYQRDPAGALLVRPVEAGGAEREVLPCALAWAVAPQGLVYQECAGRDEGGPGLRLRFWDARSGNDRLWATVDADSIGGLSVAPDGRSVAYGHGRELSSLVMIEGFR